MTALFAAAERFDDAVARHGTFIVIRRYSTTPGPVPLLNPPTVQGPVLVGLPAAVGDTQISLLTVSASGRLVPGDVLAMVGGPTVTVATTTLARVFPSGFSQVGLTAPLTVPIAAYTPLNILYAADITVSAVIGSYPLRLIDGERIQSRDIQVTLGAFKAPDIRSTWGLILLGREFSIVEATPAFERSTIVSWSIQAR